MKIDQKHYADLLRRRTETDLMLLEEAFEEMKALRQYMDDFGPDAEYRRRGSQLVNMTAAISDGNLWEFLTKRWDMQTGMLDLEDIEIHEAHTDRTGTGKTNSGWDE